MSATDRFITSTAWKELVYECLGGYPNDFVKGHALKSGGAKKNCKSCYQLKNKTERKTTKLCQMCGPICKHCHPREHKQFQELDFNQKITRSVTK